MIFYFNLGLNLLFFIYFCFRTAQRSMILSPHMIVWAMPLLLFFYPALVNQPPYISDDRFNLIFTFGLVGTLVGCVIFKIPTFAIDRVKKIVIRGLPNSLILTGALVYAGYLLMNIIDRIVRYGGIGAALSVDRLNNYLTGGILQGNFMVFVIMLPEILYYFLISKLFTRKNYVVAVSLVILISIYYVFTSNTRFPMIMPIISLAILIFFKLKSHRLIFLMPILIIFGFIGLMSFNVIGNLIRYGTIHNIGGLNFFESFREIVFNQAGVDLGYYSWMHELYQVIEQGKLQLDYGMAWGYYGLISLFPRFLWPDKPLTSTSNRLTELVYDVKIGEGVPITTFTVLGEGFWQGYFFGVFLAPILFIALYCWMIRVLKNYQYSGFWIAMLLVQMVTFYRSELPVPQFLFYSVLLLLLYFISRPMNSTLVQRKGGDK